MTSPGFASDLALSRFHLLQPHFEADVPLAVIARQEAIGERTLRRWKRRYKKEGITGLERKVRSDRSHRRSIDPELEAWVKQLATKRRRPTLVTLHRQVCERATRLELPLPSYSVVTDIVRGISSGAKLLQAHSPEAYANTHELVHRREASAPNEVWQADHTLLDIALLDDKGNTVRPWLSLVIDDYSRAIAGYFLSASAPSAINTALALKQAIWHKADARWVICGIPEILYVDNGSDFTSEHLAQASVALKMQIVHSFPGKPRGRGRIERLFRTINDMFLADLPGRIIKGKALSKPMLDMDQFETLLAEFIHAIYHTRQHGTTGEAPQKRWQAGGFLPNLPDSTIALDMLLLRVSRLRLVARDGIRFKRKRYTAPTLAGFIGESIELLYDPRDLAEIHVYHEGQFICRALAPEHPEAPGLRDIQKARNAIRKQHRAETAGNTAASPPKTQTSGLKLYAADD